MQHAVTEMIDAKDKETWDRLHNLASESLVHNPSLHSKLERIHQNPQYYSYWYLLKIEGNMKRKGSVPSEINHSSLNSHLGKGNALGLPENVERLHTRYEQQLAQRQNA